MHNRKSDDKLLEYIEIIQNAENTKAAAQILGVNKRTVFKYMQQARARGLIDDVNIKSSRPSTPTNITKIKADNLINQEKLDANRIVRAALDEFEPDDCVYDDNLFRDLGISRDRWRDVRDMPEFKKYQIMLPNRKRVWCLPKTRNDLLRLDGVREVT